MYRQRSNSSTLNEFQKYLLNLYKTKKWNIKLTTPQHQVLLIFCEKEIAHAYECRKYLISKFEKEIAPKNVRKLVLTLYSLGLIKRHPMEEVTKHSAIYYTLSPLGIFYLINESKRIFSDLHYSISIDAILKNHPHNIFFKYFLYPIIEQRLVNKIDNYDIFAFLNSYLNNCTRSLITIFDDLLQIEKNGGQSYYITTVESLLDSSLKENDYGSLPNIIKYIQDRFNITGLDPTNSKIEEIKKNGLLKITSNKKILFLKRDNMKNKLLLYEQGNKNKNIIFKFNLERIDSLPGIDSIIEFRSQSIEDSIIFYQQRIEREYLKNHLPKLLHNLLENCHYNYHTSHYNTRDIFENYSLLANNPNSLIHLDKLKQDFDSQYNLFKSMTNTIF